jgi:MFS family permease
MTPTTQFAAIAERYREAKVVGLVSIAHFVSHYYFYILPPVFLMVKAEFDVSYVELGIALTAFHILSAVLQTPAGFVIDRVSARGALIGGLMLGGVAVIVAGVIPNFYVFVAMFAIAGIANTVYHPADYSLISTRVSDAHMSKAYSVHIFAGYFGTAVTPACQILLAGAFGWRGAFVAAGVLGLVTAALLLLAGGVLSDSEAPRVKADAAKPKKTDWSILLSPPVLLNVLFFILIAMSSGAIQTYGLVAIQALGPHSVSLATTALTVNLSMAAIGVIAGGFVSSWTSRQDLLAMSGLCASACFVAPIGMFDLGAPALIALMGIAGFFTGLITSSRDMLVRAVTPPGAFGAVFGFVTTGFAIGGIVAPLLFGWMMDHGLPHIIFLGSAFFAFLAIPTVMVNAARIRAGGAAI